MKYYCEVCDFDTDRLFCLNQHKNTKKHKIKVNESKRKMKIHPRKSIIIEDESEYVCIFCEKSYSTASNLKKHQTICKEKGRMEQQHQMEIDKLNEKISWLEKSNLDNKSRYESELETLRNENAYLKTLINNAGSIIKTSVSAMSYVSDHYADAPALEPVKDYSKLTYDIDSETNEKSKGKRRKRKSPMEVRKDKDRFIDILAIKYEKNILDRYLGDIIIKYYKKKNPKEQSLWSSDTSRLTYVIRELFANKQIDWTIDKKGVKTKKYIVKPFLEHIESLMSEYIKVYSITNKDDIDMRDYEPKLIKMHKLSEIMANISNGTLAESIVGYVAPEFYLNKEKNLPALEHK